MQVFNATLNQMLVLFTLMVLGYFLNKKGFLPKETSGALSKLETLVLVPCLSFHTFYKYCTIENMQTKWVYILYGTALLAVSIVIGFLLAIVFTKEPYHRKIYAYAFAMANFGFMGNAVVLGVFGEAVLFDYMVFTLPLNLYVYSYGTASLIPQQEGKKLSLKAFLNPICISMFLGGACGLLGVPLPQFVISFVSSSGACMSPLAMLLTGFVIANFSLKQLASNKKIYIASFLRLIVLPLIFVLVLKALNTDPAIVTVMLCATAMPLGLNTVVFPAAYGADTLPGASMALISHVLSVITIPLMFGLLL